MDPGPPPAPPEQRDLAPGDRAATRADALLAATNAFLGCEDLTALGDAITAAVSRIFGAQKAAVAMLGDDHIVLAAAIGYTDDDRAEVARAIERSGPLVERARTGLETWSTDPDGIALRDRATAYGARAGFTLPISSRGGLVGTISALFDRDEAFEPDVRQLARSLAAQAALAWELIGAREDQRRSASEAARRGHVATVLLSAANRLAVLTDPDEIPGAVCQAARDVTGASFAGLARRVDGGATFQVLASVGLPADVEAAIRAEPLTVERAPFLATLLDPDVPPLTRLSDGLWATEQSRLVFAPIRIAETLWGVIALGVGRDDARPTDDWQALVDGLASIGGAAVARAEATTELERQRRRSNTLLELSLLLADLQDPGEIARRTCTFIREAGDVAFSMIGRRATDGDAFSIAATAGLSADQVARIEAALDRTDRPSLRELLAGGLATRTSEHEVGAGLGIGQAMGAPILVDGRTIGFIAVGAPTGEAVRRDEWQDLLTAFAALTATALARAEAVDELARGRDVLAWEVAERTRSLRTAVDELRVASDAKTDFLANVSHELRTPLTSILGFAEVLAGGMDGALNGEQARDVETIQASSRHLLELIDDLIDVASIEAGRMDLAIAPVDAGEVIRDAAARVRPLAGEKGIAIDIEPSAAGEGTEPVLVAADRTRLCEIVLNVLSNAVKFTPSGGSVRVSLMVEPARDEGSEATVAIVVRDTGVGIAPADHERVFEKFVRIAGPATPGTGLGLSIARELSRLHGGDLTVESVQGLGSTFTIRIPVAPAPAP